ncbi:metallopeptidase family protein [Brevibacterium atlanticum]|uniref:metallopeptidase family protein n=1 Tax=Brevibacterium atlanticum TaxID=2697563 RepID=UPI0014243DA0|nr:metallopeptidase family protein [Brevibacterium atlanticum]
MRSRRYRDRHGRGLRSPLHRAQVPARLSRAQSFAKVAAAEFARMREREPALLAEVIFAIDGVPPASSTEPCFGRVFPATSNRLTHIVLYRRVIEDHAEADTRDALIAEVVADQVDILRRT